MTHVEQDDDAVVRMRDITIEFPGVKALESVDLTLRAGEVHTLMGENGAGKSTLIKALTGVYPIDAGTIHIDGAARIFKGTADAQDAGVWTVYQEVNLCANLTVGKNVMLGQERRGPFGIDWKATNAEARGHLESLGLRIDPRSSLASHSIAIQQLVAISRAMVSDCKVLVLDEPTSSLDRGEVEQLFAVMRGLRERGVAILFVTHFLDQVYEISDRLTVLRNGRLVGEYAATALTRGELIAKMLGRELAALDEIDAAERAIDRTGAPLLAASGLGRRGVIDPVDIDVFDGEVVGIAGLLGSGRTELARLLFAADREIGENIVLGIQARRGWPRRIPAAEKDAAGRGSSRISRSARTSSSGCRRDADGCAASPPRRRMPSSRSTSPRSASGRPTRTRSSAICPEATSRRSSSRAGSRWRRSC